MATPEELKSQKTLKEFELGQLNSLYNQAPAGSSIKRDIARDMKALEREIKALQESIVRLQYEQLRNPNLGG